MPTINGVRHNRRPRPKTPTRHSASSENHTPSPSVPTNQVVSELSAGYGGSLIHSKACESPRNSATTLRGMRLNSSIGWVTMKWSASWRSPLASANSAAGPVAEPMSDAFNSFVGYVCAPVALGL